MRRAFLAGGCSLFIAVVLAEMVRRPPFTSEVFAGVRELHEVAAEAEPIDAGDDVVLELELERVREVAGVALLSGAGIVALGKLLGWWA